MPKATRIADTQLLGKWGSLTVEIGEGRLEKGDAFVDVVGINPQSGELVHVRIEFCNHFSGGGYHPKTILALYNLVEAIQEDNEDPESPARYKLKESF